MAFDRRWIGCMSLLVLLAAPSRADEPRYQRRWFYAMMNLQVGEQADRLIDLIGRAKEAGYNGVVLADYKLSILDRVPEHYFTNARRVKEAADAAGVEIIPAVFPIGYSNGLLAHDPNLAEGVPVIDAPFNARQGEAVLDGAACGRLVNGDLEQVNGSSFVGYSFQDDPGQATVPDRAVHKSGRISCRIQDQGTAPNRRLIQRVRLRPQMVYRLSCAVKTEGLANRGGFRVQALGASEGSRALSFYEGPLGADQEWTIVSVVFNSLDRSDVNLYVGLWGGGAGTLWIDDIRLDPLGPVNVLRRPGCPVAVKDARSGQTYEEGRDFAPLVDPKLGQVPYAGEYEFGHDAPKIGIPSGSRIKPGQKLLVSWYHPILVHGSQIMACPSEGKTYEILRDQARRVNELFRPRTYFMSHDEIRVLNWCAACRARKLPPGQILADNARRCTEILREIDPRAEAVVWSDMFDPHHNAVDNYYLVNGTLAGSWEGLSPRVTIANWNGDKRRESLAFFSGRGHRQVIAGYYDAPGLEGFTGWDEAARGVKGVDGFMYTTWQANFADLRRYGEAMRSAR